MPEGVKDTRSSAAAVPAATLVDIGLDVTTDLALLAPPSARAGGGGSGACCERTSEFIELLLPPAPTTWPLPGAPPIARLLMPRP